MHLYWDFENNKELKKLDPLIRVDLALALKKKLNVPISHHVAGFDNVYIEIDSNDPVQWSLSWKDGMIPRAGFIQRVAVRHLTHQSKEFIEKVQKIADEVLLPKLSA